MKVDTKSVSFQILTLTDWHRPTLISCRISRDQHQISVRCERYKSVSPTKPSISPSCLFVCSSKPLPPSRGEKTDMEYGYWHWPLLYCLVSTVVSQVLFVWNISKYSIQQARHADPPQQLQTRVWTPLSKTLSMGDQPLPDFPYSILLSWCVGGLWSGGD